MKTIILAAILAAILISIGALISYLFTAYIFNSFSFSILPGWEGILSRACFLSLGFLSGTIPVKAITILVKAIVFD